jgi:hypothetical protein
MAASAQPAVFLLADGSRDPGRGGTANEYGGDRHPVCCAPQTEHAPTRDEVTHGRATAHDRGEIGDKSTLACTARASSQILRPNRMLD